MLVDGEHDPAVVRAAVERLPARFPQASVVGAALIGAPPPHPTAPGAAGASPFGVPTLTRASPDHAVVDGLDAFAADAVVDLSDEPALDARTRLRLVARALEAGAAYHAGETSFVPPPRPRVAAKPSLAVIGTGKRPGKTAVVAEWTRLLAARGTPAVVVSMDRAGSSEPDLVDPAAADLSLEALVARADGGQRVVGAHVEVAALSGAAAIGTRRCGAGPAGAPGDDGFAAGVALANERPEPFVVFDSSGQAVPPVHAGATALVVPNTIDPELVTGYLGAYRVLLSDVIVVTMGVTSLAGSVPRASFEGDIRRLVEGVASRSRPLVRVTLRPTPLAPISGRRVFYATTAPATARAHLAAHLEYEHGARVVGTSHHLADSPLLQADLDEAGDAEVLVVELKAAAVDLAVRHALARGMEVVFCDNRVVTMGGDGSFEDLAVSVADLAARRFEHDPT